MSFTFEALKARYGDCLFLTFRQPSRTLRMLVDGGPAKVYKDFLRKRLETERQADPDGELVIDAVMVSHIDEDHVLGLLDMFGELQDADARRQPRPWDVRWLLHNSFDALLGEGEGRVARALGGETVLASLGGAEGLSELLGRPLNHEAELVLQSYDQGSRLATLAAALKITRNPPDGSPIMSLATPRVLKLGGASFTIVGPREAELADLRKEWAAYWADKAKKDAAAKAKAAGLLAIKLDDAVPNLSSIVALLEYEGRKVLLTGDARADFIHDGLKAAGKTDNDGALHLDILKMPHHGSIRNITEDFLKKVTADHYVASGDGTYGNPDRATLELLEAARPEGGYAVHLTYDAETCDAIYEPWKRARPKLGPFDPAKDTIAPVIARWKQEGRITVHEGPVKIDL